MASRPFNRPKTPKNYGSREMLSCDPVEVYCRLRPTDQSTEIIINCVDDQNLELIPPSSIKQSAMVNQDDFKVVNAKFTKIFGPNVDQKEIFDVVALDLCRDLLLGKNGLLFTYGVSGSGKTHTMTGMPSNVGILPRCLHLLFNSIEAFQADPCTFSPDKQNGFDVRSKEEADVEKHRMLLQQNTTPASITNMARKFKRAIEDDLHSDTENNRLILPIAREDEDNAFAVFVSYVEIYNDYIYDLLDPPADRKIPKSKDLKFPPNKCTYVNGVIEVEVRNVDEAFDVLARGQAARRVAHTALNAVSSRSHSVFNIRLVKAPLDQSGMRILQNKNEICIAQLSLVDLAGSENTKKANTEGGNLMEAGQINVSLFTLRQCMEILRKRQKFRTENTEMVPYRDSSLTKLFKNYFDGEGKVKMIVCVSPSASDYKENLHVLRFAEATSDICIKVAPNRIMQAEGLTPGRRRAQFIIQQVRAEVEEVIGCQRKNVIADLPIGFPAFETPPFFSQSVGNASTHLISQYILAHIKRKVEFVDKAASRGLAFDLKFRQQTITNETLARKHQSCETAIRDRDKVIRTLRDDISQMTNELYTRDQRIMALEEQLRKRDENTRLLQNQEEIFKRNERELTAHLRSRDDKLREIKDMFERMPNNRCVKKLAPSPPPKPSQAAMMRFRQMQTALPSQNVRRQRRSRSAADVPGGSSRAVGNENCMVSHWCSPARKFVAKTRVEPGPATPFCRARNEVQQENIQNSTASSSESSCALKRPSLDLDLSDQKRSRQI